MPLEYEFYARQVSPELLEQEVDAMNGGAENHLTAIAKELEDWENVAPQLDILPKDVRDIKEMYHNNPANRRCEMLRVWKRNTAQATYDKLLKVCVDTSNKDSAQKIVDLLKEAKNDKQASAIAEKILSSTSSTSNDSPAVTPNECPKYDKKKQEELFKAHKPGRPPRKGTPEHTELTAFRDEVILVLQTVKESEYQAAVVTLEKPSSNFEHPVVFPSNGGLNTVLGCLADHKVALIHTDAGSNIKDSITDAIKTFKKAKFIIGVGFGYTFDRIKYKFGDVLVSKKISDLRNWKFDRDGNVIDRGERIDVNNTLQDIFCRGLNFDDDFEVALPLPAPPSSSDDTGRIARVYSGTFASCAFQINDKDLREKIGAAVPEVIGGEMEGGELMQFQKRRKIDGVIVIKGVVDFDRDVDVNEWEFTASMAALAYTRDKLYYYQPPDS